MVNPVIRQIVDRCHVGDSDRSVIRFMVSRLKYRTFAALPKSQRKTMLRQCLVVHHANRALYQRVMMGAK